MKSLPIAAQVYSVREEAAADFTAAMEQLARMGYDGVELAGLYGKAPGEIRACLDSLGLRAIGAHVPYEEFERDLEKTIADYREIGCSYLAIPALGEERRYGREKYEETLQYLAVIGNKCKDAGMGLLYHNHSFEFARTPEGEYHLDALFGAFAPEVLATELDLCWVKVGGADPVAYLQKYSGRCPLVHVKDYVYKDGVMQVAVGEGELRAKSVVAQAIESGARWLVVEQDDHPYDTPMENMKKSVDYLKSIFV